MDNKKLLLGIKYLLIGISLALSIPKILSDGLFLLVILLWVSLFQLNWFAVNIEKWHQVLTIANLIISVPILLYGENSLLFLLPLAIGDIYIYFSNQIGVYLTAIFSIAILVVLWPIPWFELAVLIALSLIYIAYLLINDLVEELNAEKYVMLTRASELKESSALLNSSLMSSKEMYTMQERNRISRDLHDSVGHTLSTVIIQLEAIAKLSVDTAPTASQMSLGLRDFTRDNLDEVRQAITNLKPKDYNRFEFIEVLSTLTTNYGSSTPLDIYFNSNEPLWELNPSQQEFVYRAIQEFLSNTSKHANADELRIILHFNLESVIITMQDNGIGTDALEEGIGIKSLKERAKLNNATVTIISSSGNGFKTRIVLNRI